MCMIGLSSLACLCPGGLGRYARRARCECRASSQGILIQENQPAFRSANMISSWQSTMSQFRHRACQCFTIHWAARYSIRRRESSLVKEGLFFVICRNCRFRPSIIFVVYMIFRISGAYSMKVLKTPQFSSQLRTQEGYCSPVVSSLQLYRTRYVLSLCPVSFYNEPIEKKEIYAY